MKFTSLITAFLLLNLTGYCQTNIRVITQNPDHIKFDKVDAFDDSQIEILDTSYNDTLDFAFNKKDIDCYWIRYHANGKIYPVIFWSDPGNITVRLHFDSSQLVIDTVLNSPTYYDFLTFNKKYTELYHQKDTLAMNELLLDYYKKNIESPYSLIFGAAFVKLNENSKENLLRIKPLADKQGNKFDWFTYYEFTNERLVKLLNTLKIKFSDFTFINRKNKKVKLPASNSKYRILDLWFLACAPCIADHKEIARSGEILKNKGAELISISIDDNIPKLNAYLTKNNYSWGNYLQTNTKKISRELKITTFPTYLILDGTGNILQTTNYFSSVLNWLDKN